MPSSRFHQAVVRSHQAAGRGYYRLLLHAPEAAAAAVPGQFVMLRVSENLDPLLARPFGISSASRTSIELFYRVVGRGTTLLTQIEKGRHLAVLGPIGNGFPLPSRGLVPLLVAGGSGFPPLHFFALRFGKAAHFFAGARNRDCLPPAGILKNIKNHTAKVHIATEDGSAGRRGVSPDLVNAFLAKTETKNHFAIYACGPRAMLSALGRIAAEHSIPCYVSMEERMACGVGACMGCSVGMKAGGYKRVCKDGPVFDSREIEWAENIVVPVRHVRR